MLGEVIAGLRGGGLIAAILVIGIAPGIAEELLFRGYIQTRLTARWGAVWGVLITSVLFAVFHLDPLQGVLAFAMGLFLGAITERSASIIPAMICHAANNTFATVMTAAGYDITGAGPSIAALLSAAVLLAVCIQYLRRPEVIRAGVERPA
jgi:uncharacterized protein